MKKLFSVLLILVLTICGFAQNTGINTTTPQAYLDINGDLALRMGVINLPNPANADVSTTTNRKSVYRITNSAPTAPSISGLTGGVDGRTITLINTATSPLGILPDLFTGNTSAAANRIITLDGNTLYIQANGAATLLYDGTAGRWRVISFSKPDAVLPATVWSASGNDVYNTNTGNVGLGTASPANKLTVAGNADVTGNIGLGTPNPQARLDLNGDVVYQKGTVTLAPTGNFFNTYDNIDLSTNRFSFYDFNVPSGNCFITGFSGGVDGRTITLANNTANTMVLSQSFSTSAAANRLFTGTGQDASLGAYATATLRYMSKDSLWHIIGNYNDYNSGLWQNGGNGQAVRTGNVGIGTTSATQKLTVGADGIGISQESSTQGAKIGFYTNGTNAYLQTHNNADLNFSTNNGGAQMILKTNGNLGIGVTPIAKLDVGGDVNVATGKILTNATGTNNMLPIAWGQVASSGVITAGSGNFTIEHLLNTSDSYRVHVNGYADANITVIVSAKGTITYGTNGVPPGAFVYFYTSGNYIKASMLLNDFSESSNAAMGFSFMAFGN